MYAAGALCAWASDALGPDNVRRSRIRWKKMSGPGTVLTFSGEVVAQQSVDGMVQAKVELTATDADGDVAVQAWMDFELPEHP